MMASYCIPKSSCSTHRSSWVNGDHPTSLYATVTTTVCMHWSSTCCERSYPVSITRCDGYYVYKLQRPTSCYERYCGVLGECSKKKYFYTCISFNDVQEDLSSVQSTKRVSLFMGWHSNLLISCCVKQCPRSTFVFVTLGRPQNCFFHIFSSFFSFVTQMRMMRVLEPQDQTSVLVIRVIQEILVPVG